MGVWGILPEAPAPSQTAVPPAAPPPSLCLANGGVRSDSLAPQPIPRLPPRGAPSMPHWPARFVLLALAPLVPAAPAAAQCVSLTTLGSPYLQNFDTLSNVAGSTTNNLTITGWFLTEAGGGARDNEQYAVDTGGSATGDTYSYGGSGS